MKETVLRTIFDSYGVPVFRYWQGDEEPPEGCLEFGDIWETETTNSAYKYDGERWLLLRGVPLKEGE